MLIICCRYHFLLWLIISHYLWCLFMSLIKHFKMFVLTFKFIIHMKLIFVCGVRKGSSLILFIFVLCSVAQLCLTLCDPIDCSQPGSSVHEILQARILEWLPFLLPGDLPDPGIEPVSPVSPALQADSLPTEQALAQNSFTHIIVSNQYTGMGFFYTYLGYQSLS